MGGYLKIVNFLLVEATLHWIWECEVQEDLTKTAHDTNREGCKGDQDLKSLVFRNQTRFLLFGEWLLGISILGNK